MPSLCDAARAFFASLMGAVALGIAACGGGGGAASASVENPAAPADIALLFMGNSHTSVNDVPGLVGGLVRSVSPGRTVAAIQAPGTLFLDERLSHAPTLELLRGRRWSFVVLQAQQYSSSGQVQYSTAEAEALVRLARASSAVPVLFPEWPRRGIAESARIYELHASIARREPACVPPIPQAFDLALARHPTLALHAGDGNHSAPAGAFLAALVIAGTMTGTSPTDFPFLPSGNVDAGTQGQLRGVAQETLVAVSPYLFCPNDRPR